MVGLYKEKSTFWSGLDKMFTKMLSEQDGKAGSTKRLMIDMLYHIKKLDRNISLLRDIREEEEHSKTGWLQTRLWNCPISVYRHTPITQTEFSDRLSDRSEAYCVRLNPSLWLEVLGSRLHDGDFVNTLGSSFEVVKAHFACPPDAKKSQTDLLCATLGIPSKYVFLSHHLRHRILRSMTNRTAFYKIETGGNTEDTFIWLWARSTSRIDVLCRELPFIMGAVDMNDEEVEVCPMSTELAHVTHDKFLETFGQCTSYPEAPDESLGCRWDDHLFYKRYLAYWLK